MQVARKIFPPSNYSFARRPTVDYCLWMEEGVAHRHPFQGPVSQNGYLSSDQRGVGWKWQLTFQQLPELAGVCFWYHWPLALLNL